MSVQETSQHYTAAQILEAGRRAEGEGRTDFARQFYRHLTDNFRGSAEANAAGQGLERLGQALPQPMTAPPVHVPGYVNGAASAAFPSEPPRLQPSQAQSPYNLGAQAPRPQPALGGNGWQPVGPYPEPEPEPPLPSAFGGPRAVELPRPVRDYRTGRALARLTAWVGGLQVIAGLLLLPIAILSPRTLAGLPIGAIGPGVGAMLIAAGLVQVMIGQLVRALFDHANAARDTAAIARAQSTARGDQEARSRRR